MKERTLTRLSVIEARHAWIGVLQESGMRFSRGQMVLHAADFTFSAFLSAFPLMLLAASIAGFIFKANPDTMQTVINGIHNSLPQLGVVVDATANSLIRWSGLAAIVGAIGLLLSINRLVFSVRRGFRKIYRMPKPKFFKKYVVGTLGSLGMVLLVIAIFAASYVSSQAIAWISRQLGPLAGAGLLVIGFAFTAAMFFFMFAILFWVIPSPRPSFQGVAWGALLAGTLVVIATYAINIYLNRVSKTQAIFGSLGVVVGLLLWLYALGLALFLGAQLVKVLVDRWSPPNGEQEVFAEVVRAE